MTIVDNGNVISLPRLASHHAVIWCSRDGSVYLWPSWLSAGLFLYTSWGEISLKLPPCLLQSALINYCNWECFCCFLQSTDNRYSTAKHRVQAWVYQLSVRCNIVPYYFWVIVKNYIWYMKHHSQFSLTKKKKNSWRPENIHSFVANIVH